MNKEMNFRTLEALKNVIDEFNAQQERLARCNNAKALVIELDFVNDNWSFDDAA